MDTMDAFDRILTVTLNPALDVSLWLSGFDTDEPNTVLRERTDAGGKGINVARVLHALGVPVRTIGLAGGENGGVLRGLLEADGLAFDFMSIAGRVRENLSVVAPDGRLLKINRQGAAVPPSALEAFRARMLDALAGAGNPLVLFCGSLPPGVDRTAYRALLFAARDAGAQLGVDSTVLTMDDYAELRPFVIKPNRTEFAALTGASADDTAAVARAAAPLFGRVAHILVSLGAQGLLHVDADGCIAAVPPQVPVRSTVGAGDTALAGFIAALQRRMLLTDAVRYAAACGTASVGLEGTCPITPDMAAALFDSTSVSRCTVG